MDQDLVYVDRSMGSLVIAYLRMKIYRAVHKHAHEYFEELLADHCFVKE